MKRLLSQFLLTLGFAATTLSHGAPVISEFMASNAQAHADDDGAFSDWIELRNPDATPFNLEGHYLTDNANRKTKWQFPAVTIPAGGYLVIFASDKDRRQAGAPLHTNFALSADGEYLGLIAPDGVTVLSEFAPAFPAQSADVSYGVSATGAIGSLQRPTPGAANAPLAAAALSLTNADGTTSRFTSGLPLLVLDNQGAGAPEQAQGEKPGTLQLITGGTSFTSRIGLSVRGSSSAEFPKKSFSIELHDSDGSNRSVALLGMAKVADWALISAWNYDPSHLRNAFIYALSNSIGRWAPQTRFTEMFVKTDDSPLSTAHYYGIGVLTERLKIHPDLVALQSLSPTDVEGDAVTGGYLLKIDPQDDDEYGWVSERGIPETVEGGTKIVVASPKADKLPEAQRDYIRGYVQSFEDALFADRDGQWASRDYLNYIDRASWVDYHLFQVFSKNPDGLGRSVYFTKDRGGKLKAGPLWDFDRAMGSMDVRSASWDQWYDVEDGTPLWTTGWWGALTEDPDYMQAWVDRWQTLRRDAFSNAKLSALARSLAAQIDPAAAARDSARWPDNEIRLAKHSEEVDLLVNWLQKRANWIDTQFLPSPVAVNTPAGLELHAPSNCVIAYTLDGSDPRASGGQPSANAILASDVLAVPAGTRISARVFNPSTTVPTIGSNWSSLIVVTGTAPSEAVARSSAPQLAALTTHALLTGPDAKITNRLEVAGQDAKTFVVRAIGRTLVTLGASEVLLDPVLKVLAADGSVLTTNADWQTVEDPAALAAQFAVVGAFPLSETATEGRDAAVALTLPPGSYTIEVTSATGATGNVLTEIYAADAASRVKSFGARTVIAAGTSFSSAIGLSGSESRTLLIRALGGSADASLELFSATQSLATNDNWSYAPNAGDLASAAVTAGASALRVGGRDAALLVRLAPGAYSVRVGANFSSPNGVLLEVIELP